MLLCTHFARGRSLSIKGDSGRFSVAVNSYVLEKSGRRSRVAALGDNSVKLQRLLSAVNLNDRGMEFDPALANGGFQLAWSNEGDEWVNADTIQDLLPNVVTVRTKKPYAPKDEEV